MAKALEASARLMNGSADPEPPPPSDSWSNLEESRTVAFDGHGQGAVSQGHVLSILLRHIAYAQVVFDVSLKQVPALLTNGFRDFDLNQGGYEYPTTREYCT